MFVRVSPSTCTKSVGMPIAPRPRSSNCPAAPPTKPIAKLSTPSAPSARETFRPLPPQSKRDAVARVISLNTICGTVNVRSKTGLGVTVMIVAISAFLSSFYRGSGARSVKYARIRGQSLLYFLNRSSYRDCRERSGSKMRSGLTIASTPDAYEEKTPLPTPATIAAPNAPASVTLGRMNGRPVMSAETWTQASDLLPPPTARKSAISTPVGGSDSTHSLK